MANYLIPRFEIGCDWARRAARLYQTVNAFIYCGIAKAVSTIVRINNTENMKKMTRMIFVERGVSFFCGFLFAI
jgi:hypothetical protein